MQGFGETTYPNLVLVGLRERRWNSFENAEGGTVPGGERFYLVCSMGSDELGELGEVQVESEAEFRRYAAEGFGTPLEVTGTLKTGDRGADKGRKIITPSAIKVLDPAL